ncbi:MAG TPA: hypothetical protein VMU09_06840, partial [Acidimicrobiales bacterium]|nr:hypothetical protein [Acidimicrobiales bacterium]
RVVLAYDADAAGQSGASRVYEWERHHEVDVAVAALPPGSDPADLVRSDPERLRAAVTEAQPFLAFRVDRVFAGADVSTPEGRAKAAEAALAVVAEHPNGLVRDQYLMQVADRSRLEAQALRPLLDRLVVEAARAGSAEGTAARGPGAGRPGGSGHPGPGSGVRRPEAVPEPPAGAGGDGLPPGAPPAGPRRGGEQATRSGLEALRLAVHRPEAVAARLEPVLFPDPVQRAALASLLEHDDLHQAVDAAERDDPEVARLLRRLAVEEPAADADDVIVVLVRNATRRALSDLEVEARLSPDTLGDLASVAARVRLDLEDLDDPDRAVAASDRLLAWLVERGEEIR